MGPIDFPQNSVRNYYSTLCKIPTKNRRFHLHCGGSLKPR